MLELKNIIKEYLSGDSKVVALKGINLQFRKSEFVSVLGQSGCGKTTLLNIIGGLDQYTSGDLVIEGKSTKQFKDRDWDNYRNHKIGFVFQSYNLISHQTVLSNVELALTLSGISKQVRREKAVEALKKVGLGDQLNKHPSQMSGGQMQRVAIARAIVNDPDILLADEPTGALDSETSVQIMEILKEISKEKLIIMVTHNPDLAKKYSTRIINLLDGRIISDSNPYEQEESIEAQALSVPKKNKKAQKKPSMSFFTALSLSFNNLLTKKARTLLTSFAGSIGIIGIALILSVSSGVQLYINNVQEDTLSSYPITIEAKSVDATELMKNIMGARDKKIDHKKDKVYSSSTMYDMLNAMNSAETNTNNLKKFKSYLNTNSEDFGENLSAVQYSYDLDLNIYTKDEKDNIIKSDITELMNELYGISNTEQPTDSASPMAKTFSGFGTMNVWEEMLAGKDGSLHNSLLDEQYDVIYGGWPEKYNEIVLIVDENNEISDLCLYALGLQSSDDMKKVMEAYMDGKKIETKTRSWSYSDICKMSFNLVLSSDYYQYDSATKSYKDLSTDETGLNYLYDNGTKLKVTGILRPNKDATSSMINGAIGYTSKLTDYVISKAKDNALVQKQLDNPKTDVINNLKFQSDDEKDLTEKQKAKAAKEYFEGLSNSEKAKMFVSVASIMSDEDVEKQITATLGGLERKDLEEMMLKNAGQSDMDEATLKKYISSMDDEKLNSYAKQMLDAAIRKQYADSVEQQFGSYTADQLTAAFNAALKNYTQKELSVYYDKFIPATFSDSTYEDNLKKLGYVDINSPSKISLFASTFAAKDAVADVITSYNDKSKEADRINYTDYVALLMSSVTVIITAISYVLIAFVAISLIVSSIMIGIITYISVLERTKEIGILRSIGASKKDVSRVFNAETIIVGFSAGAIGIGISLLFNVVINVILHALTGIPTLNAVLPWQGAVILIIISMLLTFIAGLLPSKMAAKKDPVVALRTE